MAEITIEIDHEIEEARGWTFTARMMHPTAGNSTHQLHLSWADYNHWSASGSDSPTLVAQAVLQFMADRTDGLLKPKFDASEARRHFADADEAIPALIGRR